MKTNPSSPRRSLRVGRDAAPLDLRIAAVLVALLGVNSAQGQRKESAPQRSGGSRRDGTSERCSSAGAGHSWIPRVCRSHFAEYFDGELPVVLTLNYSDCPMLCSLQLDGLFDGLKKMKWDLGDKYRMVTVSIDPKESLGTG